VAGGFSGDSVIYYAYGSGLVVGSGHTFTANGTTPSGCFMAWSGATTTDPKDQVSAGDNQPHTVQPGSITPTQNGCLIVVVEGDVESLVSSVDSGYTVLDFVALASGINYMSSDMYYVQPTAAAINPTITSNSGTNFGMNVIQVSFLPGATASTDTSFIGKPPAFVNYRPTWIQVP
jgi:hypothetical protein